MATGGWSTLPVELLQRIVLLGAHSPDGPRALAALPRTCTTWAGATSRALWPAQWARAFVAWTAAYQAEAVSAAVDDEIDHDDACTTRYGRNEAIEWHRTVLSIVLPAWRATKDVAYRAEVLRAAAARADIGNAGLASALSMSSSFDRAFDRLGIVTAVPAGRDRGEVALVTELCKHGLALYKMDKIANAAAAAGRVDVVRAVHEGWQLQQKRGDKYCSSGVRCAEAARSALAGRHGAVLAFLLGGPFSATSATAAAQAIVAESTTVAELASALGAGLETKCAQLLAALHAEEGMPADVVQACLAAAFATSADTQPSSAAALVAALGWAAVARELGPVGGVGAFNQLAIRAAASFGRPEHVRALHAAGARWSDATGGEAMRSAGQSGDVALVHALHANGVPMDALGAIDLVEGMVNAAGPDAAVELCALARAQGATVVNPRTEYSISKFVERKWHAALHAIMTAVSPADSVDLANCYVKKAVKGDDVDLLELLLGAGAEADSTALVVAVEEERDGMLARLVNAPGWRGTVDTADALCKAAQLGALPCLNVLLPPVSSREASARALALAAEAGHADAVQALLGAGAAPHLVLQGRSVAKAVEGGHHDLVRLMLDHGARPAGLSDAIEARDAALVDMLLVHPALVVRPDDVTAAARLGDSHLTDRLLAALARTPDTDRFTSSVLTDYDMECRIPGTLRRGRLPPGGPLDAALYYAAQAGYAAIVRRLLDNGASPNSFNTKALSTAASLGHADVVAALVRAGADVHADGDNALIEAAGNDRDAVVALLLGAGADPTAQNSWALRLAPAGSASEQRVRKAILSGGGGGGGTGRGGRAQRKRPRFVWGDDDAHEVLAALIRNNTTEDTLLDVLDNGFGGPPTLARTRPATATAAAYAALRSTSLRPFVTAAEWGHTDLLACLDRWDPRIRASADLASDLLEPALRQRHRSTVALLLTWRADDGIERLPLLQHTARLGWEDIVATVMERGVADDGWMVADVAPVLEQAGALTDAVKAVIEHALPGAISNAAGGCAARHKRARK